jgi:hypothetical protein
VKGRQGNKGKERKRAEKGVHTLLNIRKCNSVIFSEIDTTRNDTDLMQRDSQSQAAQFCAMAKGKREDQTRPCKTSQDMQMEWT